MTKSNNDENVKIKTCSTANHRWSMIDHIFKPKNSQNKSFDRKKTQHTNFNVYHTRISKYIVLKITFKFIKNLPNSICLWEYPSIVSWLKGSTENEHNTS